MYSFNQMNITILELDKCNSQIDSKLKYTKMALDVLL